MALSAIRPFDVKAFYAAGQANPDLAAARQRFSNLTRTCGHTDRTAHAALTTTWWSDLEATARRMVALSPAGMCSTVGELLTSYRCGTFHNELLFRTHTPDFYKALCDTASESERAHMLEEAMTSQHIRSTRGREPGLDVVSLVLASGPIPSESRPALSEHATWLGLHDLAATLNPHAV